MSKKQQPEQLEQQGVRHNGRLLPRAEKVRNATPDKTARALALAKRQKSQGHE